MVHGIPNSLYMCASLTGLTVDEFVKGYPRLAAFVNSDDTFTNFRRFGRLSARILLHMQTELNDLERELDALDKQDGQDPIMQARLRGWGEDDFDEWDAKQQDLCLKIQEKYVKYGMSRSSVFCKTKI